MDNLTSTILDYSIVTWSYHTKKSIEYWSLHLLYILAVLDVLAVLAVLAVLDVLDVLAPLDVYYARNVLGIE